MTKKRHSEIWLPQPRGPDWLSTITWVPSSVFLIRNATRTTNTVTHAWTVNPTWNFIGWSGCTCVRGQACVTSLCIYLCCAALLWAVCLVYSDLYLVALLCSVLLIQWRRQEFVMEGVSEKFGNFVQILHRYNDFPYLLRQYLRILTHPIIYFLHFWHYI